MNHINVGNIPDDRFRYYPNIQEQNLVGSKHFVSRSERNRFNKFSATHFTNINKYKKVLIIYYNTNHPNDKTCGGSAILIKQRPKYYDIQKY